MVNPILGQTTPPTIAWTYTIPKPDAQNGSRAVINSVAPTPDGGVLIAGHRRYSDNNFLGFTEVLFYAKLSATGNLVQEVTINSTNPPFHATYIKIVPLTNGQYAIVSSWQELFCSPTPCSRKNYIRHIIIDKDMVVKNIYNTNGTTYNPIDLVLKPFLHTPSNNRLPSGFYQVFEPTSYTFKAARFSNTAQRLTDFNIPTIENGVAHFFTCHKSKLYVYYEIESTYYLLREMSLDGSGQKDKYLYSFGLNTTLQFMQDDSRIFSSFGGLSKTNTNYDLLWNVGSAGDAIYITPDDHIITSSSRVYNKDGLYLYRLPTTTTTTAYTASDNVHGELFVATIGGGSASITKYDNPLGTTRVIYVDHAAGDASELIKADIQTNGKITFGTSDDPDQAKDSTELKWQDGGRVGWRLTFDGVNASLSFYETDVPNPGSQILRLTKDVIATKANQIEIKASINGSGGAVPVGTKAVIRIYTINGKRVNNGDCEATVLHDGTSNIWSKVYINSAELSKVPLTVTGTFEVDVPGENANVDYGDRIRFQIETNYDPAQEGVHSIKTNY